MRKPIDLASRPDRLPKDRSYTLDVYHGYPWIAMDDMSVKAHFLGNTNTCVEELVATTGVTHPFHFEQ